MLQIKETYPLQQHNPFFCSCCGSICHPTDGRIVTIVNTTDNLQLNEIYCWSCVLCYSENINRLRRGRYPKKKDKEECVHKVVVV